MSWWITGLAEMLWQGKAMAATHMGQLAGQGLLPESHSSPLGLSDVPPKVAALTWITAWETLAGPG